MLSIGPQTYPNLHAGYENKAKEFSGFAHNRFEGVGCRGSGGNILIKPFLEKDPELIKVKDSQPGILCRSLHQYAHSSNHRFFLRNHHNLFTFVLKPLFHHFHMTGSSQFKLDTNLHIDQAVLNRIAAGEESAFRLLYDTFHQQVYNQALYYLQSPERAGDATQDFFKTMSKKRQPSGSQGEGRSVCIVGPIY